MGYIQALYMLKEQVRVIMSHITILLHSRYPNIHYAALTFHPMGQHNYYSKGRVFKEHLSQRQISNRYHH